MSSPSPAAPETKNTSRHAVSIIIPCQNEEGGLPQLRDRLMATLPTLATRLEANVQVLLFDNGSTDRTLELMRELFDEMPGYLIHHSELNLGIGGALRAGLPMTSGDIVAMIDSDCTYDPEQLLPLVQAVVDGWDVSTGSPYHPHGRVLNVQKWRLLLSKGLSVLYRVATPLKLWTYTSMFRAHRRQVLTHISWESDGFRSTTEILFAAAAAGYRICEVPATLSVRQFGVSKIGVVRVMTDHLRYLFGVLSRPSFQRQLRRHDPHRPPLPLDTLGPMGPGETTTTPDVGPDFPSGERKP